MIINHTHISERKLKEMSDRIGNSDEFRRMYVEEQKTISEIAQEKNVPLWWVKTIKVAYGIETDKNYALRRNKRRFETLSDYQMEFLIGSLFGDSCISKNDGKTGSFWICGHCIQQEDYLLKKAEIMKSVLSKIQYGKRPAEKGGKMFEYVRARSITCNQFAELRREFYPNGTKKLNEELFRKLTGRAFAFWFFDDGSTTGYGFDITTFDKAFKDAKYIHLFKEVLDLDVSIHWNGNEGKIHVLKSSHDKAWSYIQPEMVDSMWHKIPFKYRQGNQQPSLERNLLEGSTTDGSLNHENGIGDNTYCNQAIGCGTPDMDNTMMIQSDLQRKPVEIGGNSDSRSTNDATNGFSLFVSAVTTSPSDARRSTSSNSQMALFPSMTRMPTWLPTSSVN